MSKLCVTLNSHLRLKVKQVIVSYVINQLFARNQTIKVNSKIQRISYKSQTKVIKELYEKFNIVFVFLITFSICTFLFYLNLHITLFWETQSNEKKHEIVIDTIIKSYNDTWHYIHNECCVCAWFKYLNNITFCKLFKIELCKMIIKLCK